MNAGDDQGAEPELFGAEPPTTPATPDAVKKWPTKVRELLVNARALVRANPDAYRRELVFDALEKATAAMPGENWATLRLACQLLTKVPGPGFQKGDGITPHDAVMARGERIGDAYLDRLAWFDLAILEAS